MPKRDREQTFDAVIVDAGGGGAAVVVPDEIVKTLNAGTRAKVIAWIDSEPYAGSLAPYSGVHYLGILKSVRRAIGKDIGDEVHVKLVVRQEERVKNI